MISELIKRGVLALKAVVTSAIAALRIPPNVLTVLALVPITIAAVRMSQGEFVAAGLWIIAGGFFDVIDGAVARAVGKMTPFGGLLDSVVDRAADALLYLGAAAYFHNLGAPLYEILSIVALAGALLVSYSRARAENTVADCKVGFAERGERMVLLLLALFLDRLGPAMWLLAGLAWLTTVQRVLHGHRMLHPDPPADPAT